MVTGGASGIGRELCRQLAAFGVEVTIADINLAGAEEVAREIIIAGGKAIALRLDVSDKAAVDEAIGAITARTGRLDLLFNNAGIVVVGELQDCCDEDWQRMIDTNLMGVIHGVRAAYPVMIRQKAGQIVNIASSAGLLPTALISIYAMTKHALVGLSTSLRPEAANYGVRINVVCPSAVDTPLIHNVLMRNLNREKALAAIPRLLGVEQTVRTILLGVVCNKPIIIIGNDVKLGRVFYFLFPSLFFQLAEKAFTRLMKKVRLC